MISTSARAAAPLALALRALQLGDLLVAVPALKALRAGLPEHRLLLATSAWLAPIVALVPAVDALVAVDGLTAPLPFAPGAVDVAINLHGGGQESAALVDALGAALTVRHALSPAEEGPGGQRPRWIEAQHERERWVRLTASAGMPGDPDDVTIERSDTPSPAAGAVVLHVGAAFPSREWPVERFAQVARALAAEGRQVVLSGSAGERPRAQAVAAAAGLGEQGVLAGRMPLAAFAALVADAALVVTADTGAGHLASAYRTPSVVLFGPVPPERWGPPATGPHVALTHAEVRRGDAFAAVADPALAAVTVDEVLEAAATVLR